MCVCVCVCVCVLFCIAKKHIIFYPTLPIYVESAREPVHWPSG